jgi:hypothetical protein
MDFGFIPKAPLQYPNLIITPIPSYKYKRKLEEIIDRINKTQAEEFILP